MKNNSQKTQKNSPPSKGGEARQRRGGCPPDKQESLISQSTADFRTHSTAPIKKDRSETENTKINPSAEKIKINNLPRLETRRKNLRNNLTPAEARFWKAIQNKNLEGRKFRRQHSAGNYILDFYCPSEKLAVELDGEVHFGDAAREYDYERRLFLEHFGIKVLRFENRLVFEDLEWVLGVIKNKFGRSETTTPALRATPPLKGGEF